MKLIFERQIFPVNFASILVLLGAVFVAAQTQQDSHPLGSNSDLMENKLNGSCSPQLKVTASILEEKYSTGDNDLRSVELKLKLRFANANDCKVTLYKGYFDTSHVWISRNVSDDSNRQFELNESVTSGPAYIPSVKRLRRDQFATLSRGDTYETTIGLVLFVPYANGVKMPGSISPGNHLVRIQLNSWLWSQEDTQKISLRFKDTGILWAKPIISEALEFCIN